MGQRKTKKWPVWNGEQVIGFMPRRHFAVAVQYPGDSNFYVECRKMPPRKELIRLLETMLREDIKELDWDIANRMIRGKA
jgi:hypothetical protein